MKNKYENCDKTYEDLTKLRDENGFINLDNIEINFSLDSREKKGNAQRDKNWIKLSDGRKFLLKLDDNVLDNQTGLCYSELIVDELAKQVGIDTAFYDIVKKDGKVGVISEKIISDDEELITLEDIINGAGDVSSEGYTDLTDLLEVFRGMIYGMKDANMEKEDIKEQLMNVQKKLVFDMFTLASDNHSENISFVKRNDSTKLEISKMYDNEKSLLLESPESDIDEIYMNDINMIKYDSDMSMPKMVIFPEDNDDPKANEIWMYTFDQLYMYSDEIGDFAYDCSQNLNIDDAIEKVEERIGAKIPEKYADVAKYSFECRKKQIDRIMEYGYDDIVNEKTL